MYEARIQPRKRITVYTEREPPAEGLTFAWLSSVIDCNYSEIYDVNWHWCLVPRLWPSTERHSHKHIFSQGMRLRLSPSLSRIILQRRLYASQPTSLDSPPISDPFGYCADLVRKHDYESYLISQFWPRDIRGSYLAIKAFSVSLFPTNYDSRVWRAGSGGAGYSTRSCI